MTKARFWTDKCVLITGASSGIGKALALELGSRRARVGLIARRGEELAQVASAICAAGGAADYRAADVAIAEDLRACVQGLEQSLGLCDVAIACAGIYRMTNVDDMDPATVQAVMATNVLGV